MYFKIKEKGIKFTQFDDKELIVIDFESGAFYTMTEIGCGIWKLIEAGTSEDEIINGIANQYEGDTQDIRNGVKHFIDQLKQEGLILIDETKKVEQIRNTNSIETGKVKSGKFEAPFLNRYTDMQEMMLIDPIDDVDDLGWPNVKPGIKSNEKSDK